MIVVDDKFIVGIDHGYGYIKTANTLTRTGINEYLTIPTFKNDIMESGGFFYKVGEGYKEFIQEKTEDNDFYLLTMAGMAKELDFHNVYDADVHIACGLPTAWVQHQREAFRQYILKNYELRFRFNEKSFKIRLSGCSVFPQGYPGVIDDVGRFTGINMLADIGSEVVNIMYINNTQPMYSRCWTERIGINKCIHMIQNAILRDFGVLMERSMIEKVLQTGTAEVKEKYIEVIHREAICYIEKILANLKDCCESWHRA